MHCRHTQRAWSLVQCHAPVRTAATATATKAAPTSPPLTPNLSKWARPPRTEPQSSRFPADTNRRDSWKNDRRGESSTGHRSTTQPDISQWLRGEPSDSTIHRTAGFVQPQHPSARNDRRSGSFAGGRKIRDRPPQRTSELYRPRDSEASRLAPAIIFERNTSPRTAPLERDASGRARLDRDKMLPHQDGGVLEQDTQVSPSTKRNGDSGIRNDIVPQPVSNSDETNRLYYDGPPDIAEPIQPGGSPPSRFFSRDKYKTRGSIAFGLQNGGNIEVQHNPRFQPDVPFPTPATKKKRQKLLKAVNLDVYIPSLISVEHLARLLDVRLETLQRCMESSGMWEQSSYDHMLTSDYASLLAMEFNRNPVVDDEAAFDIYPPPTQSGMALPLRPPIVTIMGHVDHGKTTLLDTLRSASVAKGEAGGITQHIGAFSVPVPSLSNSADGPRTITFLDTPGHAAFSSMRARGASVTDIIVLVVAADDGVKPQTKEVIDLIKKDGEVGVVVAINKIDKPGIDIDRVHAELWAEGIQLESMQGDIPAVELSGLTGEGLDKLVETISALAEIRDIRSEVDGPLHGYVLESKISKGHGATATVLLLRGSLTHSSYIISGTTWAKARQMTDPTGKVVKVAGPGTAVTVSGWKELPHAGDEVLSGTETDVKKAVQNRIRKSQLNATLEDAEAINEQRRIEREKKELEERSEAVTTAAHVDSVIDTGQKKPKELRLVIKGDVSGSVEAVAEAVQGIGNQHAVVKVVSTGVGDVTESDVMMAKASEGVILAFSVHVPKAPKMLAAQNSVSVYSSSIIYQIMDEVKTRIVDLLPPVIETQVLGEATVLQLFDIMSKGRKTMKVAGCRVTNGLIEKSRLARVIRNSEAIHDGTLQTLRLFKKDVTEAKKGNECGMSFDGFEDLREGDLIQVYQTIEKPGKL